MASRFGTLKKNTIFHILTYFLVFPLLPLFLFLEYLSQYICGHNFTIEKYFAAKTSNFIQLARPTSKYILQH